MNKKLPIKTFEIEGLFDVYNVKLDFDSDVNIFIGENGLGKTTILNCIYYSLSGQVEKLKDTKFKKIIVCFDNKSKAEISHADIMAYWSEMNASPYIRRHISLNDLFSEEDILEIKNIFLDTSFTPKSEVRKYVYKISESFDMPYRYAERELMSFINHSISRSHNGNAKNVDEFKKNIKEKITRKILYFPTYRRIEEDLSKLKIDEDIEKRIERSELIQFGMNDVKRSFEKTLEKIKALAINGFNEMTGLLLQQYMLNQLENDSINNIDVEKLTIALARLGEKINKIDKEQIIEIVRTGDINNTANRYLRNLIANLIISYERQQRYDENIKRFASVCNSYLNGKEFIYDESNVELSIVRINSKKTILLENLSSGEKQVISLFSKLYLEEYDDCIILFDEPELSLSIKWQNSLLPNIMDTGKCSMLVTVTHSPFIFDNEYDSYAKNINDYIKDIIV